MVSKYILLKDRIFKCFICDKEFHPVQHNQRTCSKECSIILQKCKSNKKDCDVYSKIYKKVKNLYKIRTEEIYEWRKNNPEKYNKIRSDYRNKHKEEIKDKKGRWDSNHIKEKRTMLINTKYCDTCGTNKALIIHHKKSRKDYPELIDDKNNLIYLCETCHRMIHTGEKKMRENKLKILCNSVMFNYEGICGHARNEMLELFKLGHEIKLTDINYTSNFDKRFMGMNTPIDVVNDDYITYVNQPPIREGNMSLSLLGSNHYKNLVYFLAFESELPKDWVEVINKSNTKLVLTPSTYCKKVFKKSGVNKPIKVLPHGVDLELYKGSKEYNQIKLPLNTGFKYLWAGTAQNMRKGLSYLLDAWEEIIKKYPNSSLFLKINPIYGVDESHQKLIKKIDGMSNIYLITEQLTDIQMAELYTKMDCYVLPSLSEGFSMTLLENMACGTPVVTTSWSGQMDFCTTRNSYLVKADGKIHMNEYVYNDVEWQIPSVRDLSLRMIEVQKNPKKRRKIIKEGLKTAENYSWEKIGKQLEDYFNKLE